MLTLQLAASGSTRPSPLLPGARRFEELAVRQPATRPVVSLRARTTDSTVRAFINRLNIPSAAVSVVKDGRVVYSAGHGLANRELRIVATDTTLYEIGSISKQFAALAVMLLVEDGTLHLDDSLSRWIPEVPADWSAITIRHVLTHTSGLKDFDGGPDISYGREWSVPDYIAMIAKYPLEFAPGTRLAYTSSGYPLLGLVVQAAAGESYEAFVTRRVFRPAGLTRTRFNHTDDATPVRAQGYVDSAGLLHTGVKGRPGILAPSGGILSTARDMAQWIIALEAGLIVKPATLATMQQPTILANGSPVSAGIAWFLDTFRGHPMLLHNGSTVAGFSSVVYRYPEDHLAVVVLFNVDRFNAVNNLATRVVSEFGPPLWTGAFAERPDPDPALAERLVGMLRAVGNRSDSDLLAGNLRVPGQASRARVEFGLPQAPDRVALLDREDLGASGVVRFGNTIRWVLRYRIIIGTRTAYYTFEVTPAGLVARFVREDG